MTGLDGIIAARQKQLSDIISGTVVRRTPGAGRSDREMTVGEGFMYALGLPEQVVAKAIGSVISNDRRLHFSGDSGNYHTQVGFADLLRDQGVDPVTAAVVGVAAAIANPLDPLNKLGIGSMTKLGKAAEHTARAGGKLVKTADGLHDIVDVGSIVERITTRKKAIEAGALDSRNLRLAEKSVASDEKALRHAEELNNLMVELQKRGTTLEQMKLGGSVSEQIRLGQRHLLGFSSPFKMDQLALLGFGRGATDNASVVGFGGKPAAALVKAVTGVTKKIVKPIGDAAYKLADYAGISTIGRSEHAMKLAGQVKHLLDGSRANTEAIERDLQSIYTRFLDDGGTKEDLLQVLQALEHRHSGTKEMSIEALNKLGDIGPSSLRRGVGVTIEGGEGLSDEQKLRLTQSGVPDSEIPTAIGQFETANVPSDFIGEHKQHEVKLLGRYIVVKTSDAKAALSKLDELDGIYGNRVWAKHENGKGTYLVQLRMPGASRIKNTADFDPAHLKNIESIAAQLSNQKKGLVAVTPKDILVAPSGAVQIINPSVIADFKSQNEALANSRTALESLADTLSIPRGSLREFHSLKSVTTARQVPRGVDGLTFRSVAKSPGIGESVIDYNAHSLLEQAVNTDGYKDVVRASYDQVSPEQLAKQIGDPRDFERANNIEFHRKRIRQAIAEGRTPDIEPIAVTADDTGNLHIASGRDRLTAAILEGYESVPVYNRNFVGERIASEKGLYTGSTSRLVDLWAPTSHSSASELPATTSSVVARNYGVINRNGDLIKLEDSTVKVDEALPNLLSRLVTMGPQFVGKARAQRISSASKLLTQNFGSVRNAMVRLAELAEASPDAKTFVQQMEALLVNEKTGQGIRLDNSLRHPDLENLFVAIKQSSTKTLDDLAEAGVLTKQTVWNEKRILMASEKNDRVIQVLDPNTNTLKVYGSAATTGHLKTVAESFINRTTTAADVEPYARIHLQGVDGVQKLEVKDLVTGQHPHLADVMEPVKVFTISKEHADLLKRNGIFVADGATTGQVARELGDNGLNFGVLLKQVETTKDGLPLGKAVVRPEFSFFVTRSGALVIGTKHRNVKDLLETVFEEGPAYFEEFGVMTTGKVVMSNPFGAKMEKIGQGEMRLLKDRIQTVAKRFKELGLSDGTVLQVHVPFNDAVWRAMYGERVTIGDVLKQDFKLTIPDGLLNHTPDLRIIAPARIGVQSEVGVVAIERTRLANERMQSLFTTLENYADELFLKEAKAGLPVSYYSSWFGRNPTKAAQEAMQEAWLKHPDRESKTFKHLESFLKGRLITDLTTQEFNTVIKRLQKEGIENPADVISQVVREFRDGYMLTPEPRQAKALLALAKSMPEGLDFWHLDPIYSLALSSRGAERAITRKQIVDSIKAMGVSVWHGTVQELNVAKVGKNTKFLKIEREITELDTQLTTVQQSLEKLEMVTPDIITNEKEALKKQLDSLTVDLANAQAKKTVHLEKLGAGKVMDTMVDLESEQAWLRGEDVTKLIEDGVIKPGDILGDPGDAFVRVPIKKYASLLDSNKAEVFLFPKEVAGVVQKYFGATTREGFNKFLSLWDTVHQLWRSWTLFPIPAYHVRNGISNVFMAWLGGVDNPQSYAQAMSVMQIVDGHRKGALSIKEVQEALGAIDFASASGQVVSAQQMFDEFVRHGGLAGGLHFNEFSAFGSMVRASEFERLSIKAGLRPASELAGSWLFDNSALRLGVSAAAYVENRFRLATFIDAFTKGRVETKGGAVLSGFDAAAMHMKRVFYDYSDLSSFERSWLRRVIPFYSWSRHNIPRMMETLMTDPIKHYRMAELFHELEMGATDNQPVDEASLPDWLRKRFSLVVEKTERGNYVVKTGDGLLPMFDAYKLLAGQGIGQMLEDGLTPFVKVPIEQLTNYSLYTEKPIEKVPGQRSASFTLGSLGFSRRVTTDGPLGILNIALNDSLLKTFVRPGGEAARWIDTIFDPTEVNGETPSFKMNVFSLLVGKMYMIDPQQARMAIFSNWNARNRQLLGLRNDALEQGDMKTVEDSDRMLNWLRLQHPGEKEI